MKDPLSTLYHVPFICNFEADADAVKKILAAHLSVNVYFKLRDEKDFAAFKNNFVRPFKPDTELIYRVEIVNTPARVSLFVDFHHLSLSASYFDFVREKGTAF